MTDTMLALPVKEVEKTGKQMMTLQNKANALTLKTPKDVEEAEALKNHVKEAKKVLLARKEEITRPLMSSLASVRDLFKPLELTLGNAEDVIKAKMVAYHTLETQKKAEAEAKITEREAKGLIRSDTAVRKLEELEPVSKMKTRTLTKVKIVDETLIPREFLIPDMTKITEAVLKQGITIGGVEKYTEKIVI